MEEKEIKNQIKNSESGKPIEVNTGLLTMGLFSLTAFIYFLNAGYSYYKNIEGQVTINIALSVVFLVIGLSFLVTKKNDKK